MKNNILSAVFKIQTIVLVSSLLSCGNSDKTSIHYSTLNNKELEKQIIDYIHFIDSVGTPIDEYIITIETNRNAAIYKDSLAHFGKRYKYFDVTTICLDYFQETYAHDSTLNYDFVIKLNNKDILLNCYKRVILGVSPNKHQGIQLVKQNFPKHYKEYIDTYNGHSPINAIYDNSIECELSYYEGRLFRKEIRRFQDVLFYKEYGENPLKQK
jgi:hypothetical protein